MGVTPPANRKNRFVNDFLPLFDSDDSSTAKPLPEPEAVMSSSQRAALKKLFDQLGVTGAQAQFAMVEELTGQHIVSVRDLLGRAAQLLIHKLEERVNSAGRKDTGNAWDDREEPTWIDKL